MAWKKESGASFTGGSGQAAVISELLHRGCNAAIPLLDVGMDVFAFRDDREDVARVQVKTALGKPYRKGLGFSAKFGVPIAQLRRTDSPPLFYALAVRLRGGWGCFAVISRAKLHELWNDGCGSQNSKSGDLELHIQFRPNKQADRSGSGQAELTAHCGRFDLCDYLDAWESLPPLKPIDAINPESPHA